MLNHDCGFAVAFSLTLFVALLTWPLGRLPWPPAHQYLLRSGWGKPPVARLGRESKAKTICCAEKLTTIFWFIVESGTAPNFGSLSPPRMAVRM